MTDMIDGRDLGVLKGYWEKFNPKHPDFDMDKNILFHPEIEIKKDWILLDIGCGPGRLARLSHNLIKQYYGVDISSAMIEEAKKANNYENVEFNVNDGHTLLFEDNFFDVVVVATVFQHVGKWIVESYINEIYRTLKPGGFLIANFPRLTFYGYGYVDRELPELLKNFVWRELDCHKPPDKIDYRINLVAHFYVLARKNV